MSASSSITGRDAGETTRDGARPEAAEPLTVLQVVPRLHLGGVERGTVEIAEAILQAGGRAVVASEGGQLEARLERAGAELVRLNAATKNPLNIWQNAGVLERLIRDAGVHLVHARSRAPAWSAKWAADRTGIPFVTTYHGVYREDFPFKRHYNAIMAKGRPVIAISDFVRDLIVERHRIDPEHIEVIPRGADVTVFSEEMVSNHRTAALAESWGLLDDSRPIIMLPGRLTRWKGAESVVDAAARLRDLRGNEDFLILIVGEETASGFELTLRKRIAAAGVGDIVNLTGLCTDMAAAYKLASVVISASIEPEAFGRVAVEAQAMGRPVIATDHGGARETVVNGISGWLYPPGDAAALAACIDKALQLDPSERAHMGLAGRARIHARYTVQAMQRATLALYERAVGRTFQSLV